MLTRVARVRMVIRSPKSVSDLSDEVDPVAESGAELLRQMILIAFRVNEELGLVYLTEAALLAPRSSDRAYHTEVEAPEPSGAASGTDARNTRASTGASSR